MFYKYLAFTLKSETRLQSGFQLLNCHRSQEILACSVDKMFIY